MDYREEDLNFLRTTILSRGRLGIPYITLESMLMQRNMVKDDQNWKRYTKFDNYFQDLVQDVTREGDIQYGVLNKSSYHKVYGLYRRV